MTAGKPRDGILNFKSKAAKMRWASYGKATKLFNPKKIKTKVKK